MKALLLTVATLVLTNMQATNEVTKEEKIQFIATYFGKTMDIGNEFLTRSVPDHAKKDVNEILSNYYKDIAKEYETILPKYLNDNEIDSVYNFYKSSAAEKMLELAPDFAETCINRAAKLQSDIMAAMMKKTEDKTTKSICTDDICEIKVN